MSIVVHGKVLQRRDINSNWSVTNPILGDGEIGLDETVTSYKVGDGITAWNNLPYWGAISIFIDKSVNSLLAAGQPVTFFLDISSYPNFNKKSEIITKSPDASGKLVRYTDMLIEDQDTIGNGTGTFTGWKITGHSVDGTTLSEDLVIIISGGSSGTTTPSGSAGGDLTGNYPNPQVNQINGITKTFYDPTSSIQAQLNARQLSLGFTPYNSSNPAGYITAGAIPTNISSFINDVPYATINQIKVGRNGALFGETGSLPLVINYANTGGDNTFTVGTWLNFLSGTGNVIVQVTWTDGHGYSHTKTFYESGDPTGTVYGNVSGNLAYAFDTKTMRVKDSTTIQISTTVSGSVIYEVGGFIQKIIGDGGL